MGISINRWSTADWYRSPDLMKRLDRIGQDTVKSFMECFLSKDPVPNFSSIEIETINRCNNDCPFCPVNRNSDPRKFKRMDENLFYMLIEQLKSMDYSGTVGFYSNNEPLLDERIFKFIEYGASLLPKARKVLYTNTILLNNEKFLNLVKYLDKLILDNYDDDLKFNPSVQKILDSDFPKDFKCNVEIWVRKKNQKLFTRGGSAPNRINEENKFAPVSACNFPFEQMIIRPDGTAAKCCQDPLTDMVLGDLNKQTLLEIWRGKPYQEFRKEMYFNGRRRIKGCTYCDTLESVCSGHRFAKINEYERMARELKLRKNLGKIYLFDIIPLSLQIQERMKSYGVEFDGMINVRNVDGGGVWSLCRLKKLYKNAALYFSRLRIMKINFLKCFMQMIMCMGATI